MRVRFILVGLLALLVMGLSPQGAEAATTSTASLSNTEVQPDTGSFIGFAAMDLNGQYVAFQSDADNLSGASGTMDVYVRTDGNDNGVFSDAGDSTVLISRQGDEAAAANGWSGAAAISPLGRFVVFQSAATNLPQDGLDTNGLWDIFLRDRDPDGDGIYDEAGDPGATGRTSVSSTEEQATGGDSRNPAVSYNGDFVFYESDATNLVSGDSNGRTDIFYRDRLAGTTSRSSVDSCEGQANGDSVLPAVEYSGSYVSFQSDAADLDLDANNDGVCEGNYDTNGFTDIFLRDRTTAQLTYRVSVPDEDTFGEGTQGNGRSFDRAPVSLGGRFVVFRSSATNLVFGDTNGVDDIFVRDLDEDNDGILNESGATSTVHLSVDSDENAGNGPSYYPRISRDGRYVGFTSSATNLVSGDTNGVPDVFVRDRDPDDDGIFDEPNAYTVRVSLSTGGVQSNGASVDTSLSISRRIAFESDATNLVGGDANGVRDVFVRSLDDDGDTILEPFDNCPTTANPGQENSVHPGTPAGDHCEDPEPDGVFDITDNCPDTANPGQQNAVHPGTALGDHCEDPEPDGVFDISDNCPDTVNPGQENTDGDGLGDACDCDDDNDAICDTEEQTCGADPLNASKRPERLDGPFAGVSDDGDADVDEALTPGSEGYDCDGDGYIGTDEAWVFATGASTAPDQDSCGNNGWPSDLYSSGMSANLIDNQDAGSFVAPVPRIYTSPGDPFYSVRWDLKPGPNFPFPGHITPQDIGVIFTGTQAYPPMLGGTTPAFGAPGPVCPWPP